MTTTHCAARREGKHKVKLQQFLLFFLLLLLFFLFSFVLSVSLLPVPRCTFAYSLRSARSLSRSLADCPLSLSLSFSLSLSLPVSLSRYFDYFAPFNTVRLHARSASVVLARSRKVCYADCDFCETEAAPTEKQQRQQRRQQQAAPTEGGGNLRKLAKLCSKTFN